MILYKSLRRSCGDLAESSPKGPCTILRSSYCEDLVDIRVKSSLAQVLLGRSCRKILWVSCHGLYKSFWEDLVGILFKPSLRLKRPCSKILSMLCMILYRSLTEDLAEILVGSSLRGSLHEELADAMPYRWWYESSCVRLLRDSCLKIL